jgi:hypothetical protein
MLCIYSYESDASLELMTSQWTFLTRFFHPSLRHSPVQTPFPDDKKNRKQRIGTLSTAAFVPGGGRKIL